MSDAQMSDVSFLPL